MCIRYHPGAKTRRRCEHAGAGVSSFYSNRELERKHPCAVLCGAVRCKRASMRACERDTKKRPQLLRTGRRRFQDPAGAGNGLPLDSRPPVDPPATCSAIPDYHEHGVAYQVSRPAVRPEWPGPSQPPSSHSKSLIDQSGPAMAGPGPVLTTRPDERTDHGRNSLTGWTSTHDYLYVVLTDHYSRRPRLGLSRAVCARTPPHGDPEQQLTVRAAHVRQGCLRGLGRASTRICKCRMYSRRRGGSLSLCASHRRNILHVDMSLMLMPRYILWYYLSRWPGSQVQGFCFIGGLLRDRCAHFAGNFNCATFFFSSSRYLVYYPRFFPTDSCRPALVKFR